MEYGELYYTTKRLWEASKAIPEPCGTCPTTCGSDTCADHRAWAALRDARKALDFTFTPLP